MKKYIIDKDNPNEKLLYYNVDVVGLSVTPNKSVPGYKITAKKLTLVDPDLREGYIKQKINKKIDRVIKFMIKILNDDFKVIDILRKYTFVQYEECFREIGSFKINAQITETNLFLLEKKKFYVLFDNDIFGDIT